MNSGNMSAMKEVEKADKKWLCILFGIPYEAEFQGEGTGSAAHVYNECGEEVLTYTEGVGCPVRCHFAYFHLTQIHKRISHIYVVLCIFFCQFNNFLF